MACVLFMTFDCYLRFRRTRCTYVAAIVLKIPGSHAGQPAKSVALPPRFLRGAFEDR